jgi:alkylation response protein AidB-like acyl-CoA dehydrogenase
MDLRFTPEESAFREEVRTFIKENLPADIHHRMKLGHSPRKEDTVRWQRILNAKGWAGLSWPKEWGGTGWTAIQKMIFLEENQAAPAPELSSFNITMIGPVLIQFGTDAQKKRFLARAANIDDWWCQGFSEPGAGSDLASLKTAAKREGDQYVVNGQKIWTSTAHVADWCFLLVRTDPNARKRQEGISFLLLDMKTPGITVRPIISIDGSHHLNEVFFDDVKVPVENLVHQENKGWDVAKFLLGNERTGIARLGKSRERMEASLDMARKVNQHGRPLVEDADFRRRVAQIQVDMKALEITQYRVLSNFDASKGGKPDPLSSVLKVKGTELLQATTEMAIDVSGPMATPIWAQELEALNQPDDMLEASSAGVGSYLFLRASTIYGGTNEIQKNILTKAVLGL